MQVQTQRVAETVALTAKDWWPILVGGASAILAAFGAAATTLWWQNRQQTRNAKLRVFSTLMMHRKASPPTVEWVNSVNLIDLVFADDENVLAKWHELYGILCNPAQVGTETHQQDVFREKMA